MVTFASAKRALRKCTTQNSINNCEARSTQEQRDNQTHISILPDATARFRPRLQQAHGHFWQIRPNAALAKFLARFPHSNAAKSNRTRLGLSSFQ